MRKGMHFLIQVYRMELKPESLIHLVLKTLYEYPYFLSFQENHWDFHVNIYLYMQVSKLLGIMRNNWQLNYGKPFYLYVLVALHEEDSLGSGYIGQQ